MSRDMGSMIRNRVPFEPISARPVLRLPNNAKVAVWTIVNVENWDPGAPMPRTVLPPPMSERMVPDVPNWAWHEYGMRVGFWRFLDALSSRGLKATFALNGSVCGAYPQVCQAALDAGWEFMGHGYVQRPMHKLDAEATAIADTIRAIADFTGRPPRGWEIRGLTETAKTADLLAEAGIEYVADWVLDDQPVTINTRVGPLVSVPYTVEVNDVLISAVQAQPSDEILRRGRGQVYSLYQEVGRKARVMAIFFHPYFLGVSPRVKYFERPYYYIFPTGDIVFLYLA